ncbi:MAG TPA: hypothetical protein VD994_17975 [Prosthecobacter sp.]|nr:hypothetical protein [Prosthecobacter sp.]
MKTVFAFYWEHAGENGEPVAFYNVPMGESMSTMARETLEKTGAAIPETPTYEEWKKEVGAKRRCGKCWDVTRGPNDYVRHLQLNHFFRPRVAV